MSEFGNLQNDKSQRAAIQALLNGTALLPVGAYGNTVERSFADKLADTVSVKDHGATGDGVTDDSQAFLDAQDALPDGGEVLLPPGIYLLKNVPLRDKIWLRGYGRTNYTSGTDQYPSIIKPYIGGSPTNYIFQQDTGLGCGVEGVLFEGEDNTVDGIRLKNTSGFVVNHCKFAGLDRAIDCRPSGSSTAASNLHCENSVFRTNYTGIYDGKDSLLKHCTFSHNYGRGIYMNGKQWRILGCFFEFHADADYATEGYGIEILGNAGEIIILGCNFDRNGGYDIRAIGDSASSTGGIKWLLVQGCMFKRGGWLTSTKASTFIRYATHVAFIGNSYQTLNYAPSSVVGDVSPRYAIYVDNTVTGLRFQGNQTSGLEQWVAFDADSDYTWVAQGTNTGEYYLQWRGGDPYIGEPTEVWKNTATATGYTKNTGGGALSASTWAWRDPAPGAVNLGYNTLVVRVSGNATPQGQDVRAVWDFDPVKVKTGGTLTNFATDDAKDSALATIAASGSTTITLQMRQAVSRSRGKDGVLRFWAVDTTADTEVSARLPFLLFRDSAQTALASASSDSSKWTVNGDMTVTASGGGGTVTITISAGDGIGSTVSVLIANAGANSINCGLLLDW